MINTAATIKIAESMMTAFPDQDTTGRRAIIEDCRKNPDDPLPNRQLLNQVTAMFQKYPYAEKEGDDKTLYGLREELKGKADGKR